MNFKEAAQFFIDNTKADVEQVIDEAEDLGAQAKHQIRLLVQLKMRVAMSRISGDQTELAENQMGIESITQSLRASNAMAVADKATDVAWKFVKGAFKFGLAII